MRNVRGAGCHRSIYPDPVPYMDYFTLQFFFVLLAGLILGADKGSNIVGCVYYWDSSEYRSLQQAEESDTYSVQALVIWSDSL